LPRGAINSFWSIVNASLRSPGKEELDPCRTTFSANLV
jgi:hypothetical protein